MTCCCLENEIHMALQDHPLFMCFSLITTFPEFDSLFKNLVSHIAISLGTCPITSKFSVKLFECNVLTFVSD